MIILSILILVILFGALFLLSDDWKDYVSFVCRIFREDKKLLALSLLPLIIFYGSPTYLWFGVWGAEERLWNPYVFCGMPAYATGIAGYKWFDLVYVFISTTKICLFYNPLGTLLFIGSILWLNYRGTTLVYLLVIFLEIIMLYFAYYNYGVERGFLIL